MKKSRFAGSKSLRCCRSTRRSYRLRRVCRKYGVSEATFYNWRSRFGGVEVSQARRLKSLEAGNGKLKKHLAESMLDAATRREVLGENF